jgi:hypothetical protein
MSLLTFAGSHEIDVRLFESADDPLHGQTANINLFTGNGSSKETDYVRIETEISLDALREINAVLIKHNL